MPPFRLYISLDGKNLKAQSIFLETNCKPPLSSTKDWEGPEALPGTLPKRGIPAGGLYIPLDGKNLKARSILLKT
jgi:hypothetical protein